MIIKLAPPVGVSPLMFGMTVDEALVAMSVWGTPERLRGKGSPRLRVKDDALTRDVFAYFEDGAQLTAIEVWRPDGPDTSVIWKDMDIFRTDADQILAQVARRGISVDVSDPMHPTCPDITLGFTREQLGSHFEAVLVARPGYYS